MLRRTRREPLTRPLACALAGLALYGVVITLQFLAIEIYGLGHATTLLSFPAQLNESGFWELAALVLLFVIVLPPIKLLLLALVLGGLRLPRPPHALRVLFRWYSLIGPWAMTEVFLVGFFVAYTRLVGLANVEIGAAVWALGGLMVATVAADVSLDPEAVWHAIEVRGTASRPAVPEGTGPPIGCQRCGKLGHLGRDRTGTCNRCGARLWPRKPASLGRTWALLIAAAICCVGAYAYPVMTVTDLGRGSPTTIFAGMIELAAMGWWPIAIVVFIASITIPMFKIVALGAMLISVHRRSIGRLRGRTRVYRFVEVIGRWSMIDIFMVSILTALVQLGFIATVRPNGGAVAFAAVVILTMLAAFSFDPRLMWDAAERRRAAALAALEDQDLAPIGEFWRRSLGRMSDAPHEPPEATVKKPNRLSLIWLVPIVAAALAIYLGWQTLASRGPLVTITFQDGAGLSAGQTKLEHKAVALGTVEGVRLSSDFQQVTASVRMSKGAAPLLTDHARFWVVRPRFSLTNLSGLQTLVSGSYIAMDPGLPGGQPTRHFRGLDRPPGVRSDEPGRTFTLRTPSLGWLETGAPVFYRDILAGQLLDYEEPGMGKPVIIHVFVKAPYDQYVRAATHFYDVSGLSLNAGPQGIHVAVESVQALLTGGVAFANFENADKSPPAKPGSTFDLYANYDDAQNAGFRDNIGYVSYFHQSVAGLQPGSAVRLYGIRVGTVTGTRLQLDPKTGQPRVRVTFDIQPRRVFSAGEVPRTDPLQVTRELVGLGMRARVDTGNLLTGQEVIGLDMVPDARAANVGTEGGLIVWPSQGGGLQDLTNSLGEIVSKLNSIPLDQLGANADDLLASLHELAATANSDLRPVASQLPELSRQLRTTLLRADRLLASVQAGYGANSETNQSLERLVSETTEAVRSVRELANYLDRHPGSLVWGR